MESQPYSEFVKYLYERGFYIERYNINLMSYEVYFIDNKILIIPIIPPGEDVIYVFTGISQKSKMSNSPTEFRLYLEDIDKREFRDDDNIMLSTVRIGGTRENIHNLYTRSYAQWKFGQKFEKGIEINSEKYIMFQTQKEIGRFDIDVIGIDTFRRKDKIEVKNDRMIWLD